MFMNLKRLTVKAQEVVQSAIEIAQNYNNQVVEAEHVLAAIVQESGNVAENVIKKTGENFNAVKLKFVKLSPRLTTIGSNAKIKNPRIQGRLNKIHQRFSLFSRFVILYFIFVCIFIPFWHYSYLNQERLPKAAFHLNTLRTFS